MDAFTDIFAFLAGVPAISMLILAALTMFLTSDWRLSLTALLVEYLFLGLALTRFIQAEVAIAKILAGVFVVAMLYLTARRVQEARGTPETAESDSRFLGLHVGWDAGPLGLPLRLLAVSLISLALIRLFSAFHPPLLPDSGQPLVPVDIAFVAYWLGGMGVLGLIVTGELLRAAPALLTILIGFDLVYASLEPALAVTGLFAALNLLAALAFSYLATIQGLAEMGEEAP